MEPGSISPERYNSRRSTQAGDLSVIVDIERAYQRQAAWVRRSQAVQVDHRPAVLPQECVHGLIIDPRGTHDLVPGIDLKRCTLRAQRAEVGQHTMTPEKPVMVLIVRQIGPADDLPKVVHPGWESEASTERANVRHNALFPEKRMAVGISR